MAKKRKFRRYEEGGLTDEAKKRGLAASAGENVGFFERLRMGNIDDPKSEAYKRFGAGRGQAVQAAERDAIKKYTGPKDTGTPDSPNPFTGSTGPSPSTSKPTPAPAKPATKTKAPVVTKEQLEKSGFSSLRDFMNAYKVQDGKYVKRDKALTRRDGKSTASSAKPTTTSSVPRSSYRGTQGEGDAGEEEARQSLAKSRAEDRAKRNQITDTGLTPAQTKKQSEDQRADDLKRDAAKTGSQRLAEKANKAGNIYKRSSEASSRAEKERQAEARKRLGKVEPRPPRGFSSPASRKAWDEKYGDKYEPSGKKKPGMASGGAVSSASKRADGIAKRGRTRCKTY